MSPNPRLQQIERICIRLDELWSYYPDLSFGRLIVELTNNASLDYLSDQWLIEELTNKLDELDKRFKKELGNV